MAIDLNDFIFHSDYLPMPLISSNTLNVSITGSIPSNGSKTFYSNYVETGTSGSFVDFSWKIPTPPSGWTIIAAQSQVSSPGSVVNDSQLGLNSTAWSSVSHGIYIEVLGSQVRAAVVLTNQTTSAQTAPTLTIPVTISTYYAG